MEATRQAVLAFIKRYWALHGRSPTQREIAEGVDIAVGTVNYHIRLLALHRKIEMKPNRSRSIERPEE